MDTLVSITVRSASKKAAKEAIDAGFQEIEHLGNLLNYYSDKSELTAINRGAGQYPVQVSRETLKIIKKAIQIAQLTEGAFDPTIGPVVKLWDFKKSVKPKESDIKRNLAIVDYHKVKINEKESTVFLEKKGMALDLGGIAKGYGADKALNVIKSLGIKAALVAIAGDIKCFGLKADQQHWRIGIQNPRADEELSEKEGIVAILSLNKQAISTSGDYQRYFINDGTRYHHLLDPKTGMPSKGVISVSVIAENGFMADGISTGVFVMGVHKGLKLLERLKLEGIFVDEQKKIHMTSGLKGKISIFGEYSIEQ